MLRCIARPYPAPVKLKRPSWLENYSPDRCLRLWKGSCLTMQRTSSTHARPRVAIVGAGLGGVTLGIGLAQRGVPVHIYEAAEGFGEIGAGVTMGPNAVQALGLLSPALLQAFEMLMTSNASSNNGAAGTFLTFRRGLAGGELQPTLGTPQADIADDQSDVLFHLSNSDAAPSWTQTPVRMAVHRARFLDAIVKHLPPGSVTFRKTLTEIRATANHQAVDLFFADGTSAAHDLVVGCDGIKSIARQFVHGDGDGDGNEAMAQFAGEYAYRALVPAGKFQERLGTEKAMNGQLYVGSGRYIVTYPVEHGEFVNVVAVAHAPVWEHDAWLVPCAREDVLADFAAWDGRLLDLLTEYGGRDKWGLFHHVVSRPYYRGRVCLLGDSAHATTPHLGAGAGQAIEDAYILAELLAGEGQEGGTADTDIQALFAAYDAVRRPRSQQLVRWSYLTGLTYALQEQNAKENNGLEGMEKVLGERLRWLYGVDLAAHLEEAKGIRSQAGPILSSASPSSSLEPL